MYFYYLYLGPIVLMVLARKDNLGAATVREFIFRREPVSILISIPHRLADTPRWSGVSSPLTCAQNVVASCQRSRGFLHQSDSGLCVPLLWLQPGQGQASSGVPTGELYTTVDNLCPGLFQAVEYGKERHLECVLKITPATTYEEATSQCVSLGGFLTSVKTSEKLAMVSHLANGRNVWIGMDNLVSDRSYVWQEDKSGLTQAQIDAVFSPNEPNNYWNMENCVHFGASRGALKDNICWATMEALCEIPQLASQC